MKRGDPDPDLQGEGPAKTKGELGSTSQGTPRVASNTGREKPPPVEDARKNLP